MIKRTAITQGRHDVARQLKFCQLPRDRK